MKVPELYVHELVWALAGMDIQMRQIQKTYERRMRFFRFKVFLYSIAPGLRGRLIQEMLAESKTVLAIMNQMAQFKEKLLSSTGFDDDMRPVTLDEMLKKDYEGMLRNMQKSFASNQ